MTPRTVRTRLGLLSVVLLPLALAGCGEAAQFLEQTQGIAAQIGSLAGKVSSTSEAVSQTAGTWTEAAQGPQGERTITDLDFSGLTLKLTGCSLSGGYVDCRFTAELSKQVPSQSVDLSVSRAVTPEGTELVRDELALGGTSRDKHFSTIEHTLLGGVPTLGKMVFVNAPPDTRVLRVIEVTVADRTLYFQNIPVSAN